MTLPFQRKQNRAAGMVAATTLLLGAALLGSAHAGQAQAPKAGAAPTGGMQLPRNQAEMDKQLGITADQKAKIEAAKKKYTPKAKALQTQMIALQAQMRTLNTQYSKDMEAILTSTQKNKIKAMQQAAQAAQMQQQGGMMGGGAPVMGGAPPR